VTTYYLYDSGGALYKEWDGSNATYYDYNPHSLIERITPPPASGNPWRFYYDGRLSRYKIDKGGTFGYYVWDGMNVLEERDAAGAIVARYTHGKSEIEGIGSVVEAQRITGTTTYYEYLHMDHRGTVYAVSDANQKVLAKYVNDAFGRQVGATTGTVPSVPNDLIYQTNWLTIVAGGRRYGLSPSRIYDNSTGVFICRDLLPLYVNVAAHAIVNAFIIPGNVLRVMGVFINSLFSNTVTSFNIFNHLSDHYITNLLNINKQYYNPLSTDPSGMLPLSPPAWYPIGGGLIATRAASSLALCISAMTLCYSTQRPGVMYWVGGTVLHWWTKLFRFGHYPYIVKCKCVGGNVYATCLDSSDNDMWVTK
jgi:hypothetical protein